MQEIVIVEKINEALMKIVLDGSITYRKKLRGSKNEPEKLGKQLAKELLNAGAKEILKEVYETTRTK